MTSLQISIVVVTAVVVFWAVGAHNRLMQLRNAILRSFVPLDQQLGQRHALLQRQLDALALVLPASPALPDQADLLSAARAACAQAQAAAAHARSHPGAVGALNSLRLAENILLESRARLPISPTPLIAPAAPAAPTDPTESAHTAELAELGTQIAAAEVALQFARGRFNEAVLEYNTAVQQFPTRMLSGLFGFRPAGAL